MLSSTLNNTLTMWRFLIKAPYLGNLVLYMTWKIKDLVIFLEMKIKVEIRDFLKLMCCLRVIVSTQERTRIILLLSSLFASKSSVSTRTYKSRHEHK